MVSSIDPRQWVAVANERRPQMPGLTPWFDGTTAPVRLGWYERHFTDSPNIGDSTMQYWSGKCWMSHPMEKPHWRQVGDYPAWRGLDAEFDFNTRPRTHGRHTSGATKPAQQVA